jgi:hypothetical protein
MKNERTLTAAEKKKREEIAKALERDNPGMDMSRKMAIATAQAKRVIAAEACWSGYKQVGMKKKGNRQVPNCVPEKKVEEEVPGNAVGQGGVDMAPNAGPRLKVMNVTDRRRRKDKQPVMLKRFRKYVEEN